MDTREELEGKLMTSHGPWSVHQVEDMSRGSSPIYIAVVKLERGHCIKIFQEVTRLRMVFCETACSLLMFVFLFHGSLTISVCAFSSTQFSLSFFFITASSLLSFLPV